ncbi:hypothetical protein BDP67DRAFT_191743 [Colletotrichum lupini]|nr:hypothetical protein BDP67DRAFT_191743 [Colletotrichum lupini]
MAERSGVLFPFPLICFFFLLVFLGPSLSALGLMRPGMEWNWIEKLSIGGCFSAPVLPGPICPVAEHEFWSSLRVGRFTFSGLRFCSLSQCQPICFASMWAMGSSVFFIPRRSAMHRGTSWRRSRPLLADDGRPMGTQKKFPPLCVPGFLSMAPCYFDYPGRGRVACRIAPNSEVLSNCLIIDGAPGIGRASIASKARSGQ